MPYREMNNSCLEYNEKKAALHYSEANRSDLENNNFKKWKTYLSYSKFT